MGLLQMSTNPRFWAISCISFLLTLQLLVEPLEATRTLHEDKWVHANDGLLLESKPRTRTPGSHASPCTLIPGGKKGGKCTLRLKEMHVAGPGLSHAPMAFPDNVIHMGPASPAPNRNDVVSPRSQ